MTIPSGYYRSRKFPGMLFRKRTACDSVVLETPQVLIHDITSEPFATEGRRLAVESRMRRNHATRYGNWADYLGWRQGIGDTYYNELEHRFPSADNDNDYNGRAVA